MMNDWWISNCQWNQYESMEHWWLVVEVQDFKHAGSTAYPGRNGSWLPLGVDGTNGTNGTAMWRSHEVPGFSPAPPWTRNPSISRILCGGCGGYPSCCETCRTTKVVMRHRHDLFMMLTYMFTDSTDLTACLSSFACHPQKAHTSFSLPFSCASWQGL